MAGSSATDVHIRELYLARRSGTFHRSVYRVKLISPRPAGDNFVVAAIEIVQLSAQLNHSRLDDSARETVARRIDPPRASIIRRFRFQSDPPCRIRFFTTSPFLVCSR